MSPSSASPISQIQNYNTPQLIFIAAGNLYLILKYPQRRETFISIVLSTSICYAS